MVLSPQLFRLVPDDPESGDPHRYPRKSPTRERWQLKITRRYTIQSNEDRLRVAETLEDLAAWAKENPPEHTHLKVTGLPEFTSRNNSGIEDISITLVLTE